MIIMVYNFFHFLFPVVNYGQSIAFQMKPGLHRNSKINSIQSIRCFAANILKVGTCYNEKKLFRTAVPGVQSCKVSTINT